MVVGIRIRTIAILEDRLALDRQGITAVATDRRLLRITADIIKTLLVVLPIQFDLHQLEDRFVQDIIEGLRRHRLIIAVEALRDRRVPALAGATLARDLALLPGAVPDPTVPIAIRLARGLMNPPSRQGHPARNLI